jgi:hypothetical protein
MHQRHAFQVIAEAPVEDFSTLERIQKGLSRAFGIDLVPYRAQLRRGGVCVCRVSTMQEADRSAEQVRSIGANYRILDPQSRMIKEGAGRLAVEDPPPRRNDPATLVGGYEAAGKPTPPPPRPPMAASREPRPFSSENPALARTFAKPSLPAGSGQSDARQAVPAGPPPAPVGGVDLEALETGDLVLLDGSREEAPAPAAPAVASDEPASMAFAPPASEEEALELDGESQRDPVSDAPPREDPPPVEEELALAAGLPVSPPPPPPPLPGLAGVPREPEASWIVPDRPAGSSTAERTTGASFLRLPEPSFTLLDGWFRTRPRLRILVGFVLALGLGAIIPSCHARSVVASRIRPQLEDLSTAKVYGHIFSQLPNYRTPEQIEQTISDIKTRSSVFTFIMWLVLSSMVALAWFRFS